MANLHAGDRCKDCTHCKVWSTNSQKATCSLHKRPDGFHPDGKVPADCVGKNYREF
jgi:hypothetical protein